MEDNTRDISRVTGKYHNGLWIGGADVEKLDIVVASGCEVSFIRRDAEAVDLRVWVLDGTGAYTRESFPEADGVIISSCSKGQV